MPPPSHIIDIARRKLSEVGHLRQSANLPIDLSARIVERATSDSKKKSGGSDSTLPIALGAAIPIACALVIFFLLHRRHINRLKREDANDRDKELDFGMGEVSKAGKKGASPLRKQEMSVSEVEKEIRKDRGLSMEEMEINNPYLLPPGLQTSRESIHSLSRSLNSSHDPYRPATTYNPHDGLSSYPSTRRRPDDSSSYSGSSPRGFHDNESSQNLLRNAQRMSRSLPPTQRNSIGSDMSAPMPPKDRSGQIPRRPPPPSSGLPGAPRPDFQSPTTRSSPEIISAQSKANDGVKDESVNYLRPHIRPSEASSPASPPPETQIPTLPSIETSSSVNGRKSPPRPAVGLPGNPRPPKSESPDNRKQSPEAIPQPLPELSIQPPQGDQDHKEPPRMADIQESNEMQYEPDFNYDVRRLTMGVRPLPPEDPSEDPETRANRIRSFYKEYFDDSKPGPVYTQQEYYDYNDYNDSGYGYDGTFYDPDSGQFVSTPAPYAEPIGRRAMTPPPRGPHGHQRIGGSVSSGNFPPGPRAFSSASGRYGPPRSAPKKALPPPKPLQLLPTPHMLRDDSIIPIDFAPPSKIADRVAGKVPGSPKGGLVPYSHLRPAHKALASSFDDLAVMPSPHALRKSGTFTALDFAPPPRFKNSDTGSDAGSIRSNRSGRSAMQVANIRAGAYRLSRIPRGVAGTKDEITAALRPTMDMR